MQLKVCVRRLLRALGFEAEHLREDRGEYILLDEDEKRKRSFDGEQINLKTTVDPETVRYLTPYDLSSVMHFDNTVSNIRFGLVVLKHGESN